MLTAPAAVFPKEKPETLHRMSALGHKRTYAAQKGMSALPLKADLIGACGLALYCSVGQPGV